jgi:hypothetical protein
LGSTNPVDQSLPVQIGTNDDWTALSCDWISTRGLRRNGTLWTWGSIWIASGASGQLVRIDEPTQVCRETNWTGLANNFGPLALNQSGEVWAVAALPPSSEASIAAVGSLLLSNTAPRHVAVAYGGPSKVYQIRPPGTLWQMNCRAQSASLSVSPAEPWRRVGKRSDWVALWGGSGAAFGLTADGTIWSWGLDLRQGATTDLIAALKNFPTRLRRYLGFSAPMPMTRGQMAIQSKPRPLLRLVNNSTPVPVQ